MQGRLSPEIFGRVQTFPMNYWKEEIYAASKLGFRQIEWTVDSDTIKQNPIIDSSRFREIRRYTETYRVSVNSVTCDFFMENPPWKKNPLPIEVVRNIFSNLITLSDTSGPLILVVPILDNSSLPSAKEFELTIEMFEKLHINRFPVKIAFESDLEPEILFGLIKGLDHEKFGVNLDLGNSAAYGFNPVGEIEILGKRIVNIHLKDRLLSGSSCRFGTGDTNFALYFELLKRIRYCGNLILQSYRPRTGFFFEELLYSSRYIKHSLDGVCLAS